MVDNNTNDEKLIRVGLDTWKKIQQIKLDKNFKSGEEAILYLLK
jgi:hypothetical protein